jgi:sec-independent protein translocase protein TatC
LSIVDKFLEKRSSGAIEKNQSSANPKGEMAFTDHIEALRWHIVRALAAIIICAIISFFNINWIFQNVILGPANPNFIAYEMFCNLGKAIHVEALCMTPHAVKFQNTQLAGQFMMSFSVSFMLGFILAFPYVFWEIWRFIRPALKVSELKYAKGIVFWSSLLFFIGVLFAYFVIAPFTITFFADYQLAEQFENIITINNYYDTMSDLVLGMGLVFELPILVYFLSRISVLTPKLMRDQRRFAIVIIMVLAAVITPPDWFSIFLVAIPLVILYEAGIVVSAKILKEKKQKEQTLDW